MKKRWKDTNNKILAIIYSEENDKRKFLLLKLNPKTMKTNSWYIVTGGVKEGEDFEDAVKREIKEEISLEILNIKLTNLSFDYEWPKGSGKMKHEKVFLVKVKYNLPKITAYEHLDYKWLNKKQFLENIYWYGQDKSNLREILKELK